MLNVLLICVSLGKTNHSVLASRGRKVWRIWRAWRLWQDGHSLSRTRRASSRWQWRLSSSSLCTVSWTHWIRPTRTSSAVSRVMPARWVRVQCVNNLYVTCAVGILVFVVNFVAFVTDHVKLQQDLFFFVESMLHKLDSIAIKKNVGLWTYFH